MTYRTNTALHRGLFKSVKVKYKVFGLKDSLLVLEKKHMHFLNPNLSPRLHVTDRNVGGTKT
jgi:hypothetical protein